MPGVARDVDYWALSRSMLRSDWNLAWPKLLTSFSLPPRSRDFFHPKRGVIWWGKSRYVMASMDQLTCPTLHTRGWPAKISVLYAGHLEPRLPIWRPSLIKNYIFALMRLVITQPRTFDRDADEGICYHLLFRSSIEISRRHRNFLDKRR